MKGSLLFSFLTICLFVTAPAVAQLPPFTWAKSTDVYGRDMAIDDSGNVYTAGSFNLTKDLDPGSAILNLTSVIGRANADIYITKWDALGNLVWVKQIGNQWGEEVVSIAVDKQGNVYVTGYYQDTTDFDPGPGIFNLDGGVRVFSLITFQCFILKLDTNGNFGWAKRLNGPESTGIEVDNAGFVYTTGRFSDTTDFDPGTGVYNLNTTLGSLSPEHGFILKLDSAGNFVWVRQFEGASTYILSSSLDVHSNIYVTGIFSGLVDFDPGIGTDTVRHLGKYWMQSGFMAKIDSAGNYRWSRVIKSLNDSGYSSVRTIFPDDNGNLYAAGNFGCTVDFNPGALPYIFTAFPSSFVNTDAFIIKMDTAGHLVWLKRIGGNSQESAAKIMTGSGGNVLVSGGFNGTVDFDPGLGTYILASLPPVSNDIFFLVLDTAGQFIEAKQISCLSSNLELKTDYSGNVYYMSQAQGYPVDVNPHGGVFIISSTNYEYTFVGKLSNPTPIIPTVNVIQPTCLLSTGIITITLPLGSGLSYSINGVDYSNTTGVFTGVPPGTYNVTAKNAAGISPIKVVVINPPPVPPATPTFTITQPTCTLLTGIINITAPTGLGLKYSIDSGATYTNTTGVFSALLPANYYISVKDISGCISPFTNAVINAAPGTPPAPTVSTTQPTCTVATGTITITAPLGAAFTYSIDGVDYTNTTGVFNPANSGTYNVTVRNNNGCTSAATVAVIIDQPVTPPAPSVNVTQPTCTMPSGTITVTFPIANATTYSINGVTYVPNNVFTGLAPGSYNVTVNNGSCLSPVTIAMLNISLPLVLAVSASPNPISAGNAVSLVVTGNRSFTVTSWQPLASFPNQSATTQNIVVNTPQTFSVSGTTTDNCPDTAQVVVTLKTTEDVWVPNTFTPDNNGVNDVFKVYGTGIDHLELSIWNQWGKKIFSTKDKSEGWNGMGNGKAQPIGVYVYVAKVILVSGKEVVKKGMVNLVR